MTTRLAPTSAASAPTPGCEVIGDYMTRRPQVIGRDQPLADAAALMRSCGIRHLPVVNAAGRCVGILSDRDIHRARAQSQASPALVVGDAMTPDPVTFPPTALLHDVALRMAGYRCGSCIVVDGSQVVGIFTTVDALKVLAEMLRRLNGGRAPTAAPAAPTPAPRTLPRPR